MQSSAQRGSDGNSIDRLLFKGLSNESFCALVVSACHIPPLKRRRSIEFPFGPRFALLCFPARLHASQIMFPDYSSQGWTLGFSFFYKMSLDEAPKARLWPGRNPTNSQYLPSADIGRSIANADMNWNNINHVDSTANKSIPNWCLGQTSDRSRGSAMLQNGRTCIFYDFNIQTSFRR